MNLPVRIILYIVLGGGAVLSLRGFYQSYGQIMEPPSPQPLPVDPGVSEEVETVDRNHQTSHMMWYGAGLLFTAAGLAVLGGHDITRFIANRAEEFILSEDGEALRDPEYDEAEKAWANGNYLDAIQLMREHLKKHPRHQFAAIRIAEIYEKDLNNPVAAALEYEQILKFRLPPERWGWAAIHLANLYSGKLGKVTEAEVLLRRIINEYGQTSAAKKARERLGEPEPPPPEPPAATTPEEPPSSSSSSNLPPGFRPRKG